MNRYRLALIVPCALLIAAQTVDSRGSIEIHNGSKPGQFRIVNSTNAAVHLSSSAMIERKTPGTSTWKDMGIEFRLIAACPPPAESPSIELAPKADFTPVAWTGYDCEA